MVAACGGTDSSVSGVFPAEGFTGRSMRVEISGDATEWSGTPGVNFGAGVTVSNVAVASPTSLFADITIAPDAELGLRDVTITNDGTFTLKQAFLLESPIKVSFQGEAAQGGVPYFTVNNLDFETPFDLTTDANDEYLNLAVNPPSGVNMVISAATAYQLTGYALIDADATPGTFSIVSGPAMKTTAFNLGANVEIMARTGEALTGSAMGTLANIGDSKLYTINVASSPSLVRIAANTSDQDGNPAVVLLPNGRWDEALNGSRTVVTTPGSYSVVVFDNGTASGYNFSLASKSEALTAAAEPAGTTNDTHATAPTAGGLPYAQTGGTLSDAGDKDYIKFTLTAAAKVTVVASAADGQTDTVVDIRNATNTASVLSPAGPINEGGCFPLFGLPCGEEVQSPTLQAGTYLLEVTAGPDFDDSANAYNALIYLD